MVMEANLSPSPQCVGREFVRQYYTLLNKSPLHLHRFYSNDSSFVHGGLTPKDRDAVAVYGQQEIHQKIVELDFRECKAKILLVDSHRTLQDGVVIQVTGELSNNGQPMRRFMQTFVLAPQSAKKYYVRNDIFRYQDEIFSDDEGEPEGAHSDADEQPQQQQQQPEIHQYEPAPMHPPPGLNGSALPEELQRIEETIVQTPVQPIYSAPAPVVSPTPPPTVSPVPPVPAQVPAVVSVPTPVTSPVLSAQSPVSTSQPEQPALTEEPAKADTAPVSKNQWEETPGESGNASQEPKTFANLFKSGGQYPPPRPPSYQTPSQPASQPGQYPVDHDYSSGQVSTGTNQRGGQRGGRGGMMVRGGLSNYRDRSERNERGERAHSRDSADEGNVGEWRQANGGDRERTENRGGENRRFNNAFEDDQQLFVGNIPLSASEADIKEEFEKFGKVLEMRILNKSNRMGPGNRPAPNFGFIVFEDAAVAQSVLEKKQIYLHGEHRLNVEKKQHPRNIRPGGGGGPNNMGGAPQVGDRVPPGPRSDMRGGMGRGGAMGPGRGGRGGMPFNRDGRSGPAMPRGGGAGAGGNQYSRRQ